MGKIMVDKFGREIKEGRRVAYVETNNQLMVGKVSHFTEKSIVLLCTEKERLGWKRIISLDHTSRLNYGNSKRTFTYQLKLIVLDGDKYNPESISYEEIGD